MPDYKSGDVVYALKTLDDPPSGDSPGCGLCAKGDKLIIREVSKRGKRQYFYVSHEHRTDGATFGVYSDEISTMKHFSHNDRTLNFDIRTWKR